MPPKPMGKAAKGPAAPLEPDPAASLPADLPAECPFHIDWKAAVYAVQAADGIPLQAIKDAFKQLQVLQQISVADLVARLDAADPLAAEAAALETSNSAASTSDGSAALGLTAKVLDQRFKRDQLLSWKFELVKRREVLAKPEVEAKAAADAAQAAEQAHADASRRLLTVRTSLPQPHASASITTAASEAGSLKLLNSSSQQERYEEAELSPAQRRMLAEAEAELAAARGRAEAALEASTAAGQAVAAAQQAMGSPSNHYEAYWIEGLPTTAAGITAALTAGVPLRAVVWLFPSSNMRSSSAASTAGSSCSLPEELAKLQTAISSAPWNSNLANLLIIPVPVDDPTSPFTTVPTDSNVVDPAWAAASSAAATLKAAMAATAAAAAAADAKQAPAAASKPASAVKGGASAAPTTTKPGGAATAGAPAGSAAGAGTAPVAPEEVMGCKELARVLLTARDQARVYDQWRASVRVYLMPTPRTDDCNMRCYERLLSTVPPERQNVPVVLHAMLEQVSRNCMGDPAVLDEVEQESQQVMAVCEAEQALAAAFGQLLVDDSQLLQPPAAEKQQLTMSYEGDELAEAACGLTTGYVRSRPEAATQKPDDAETAAACLTDITSGLSDQQIDQVEQHMLQLLQLPGLQLNATQCQQQQHQCAGVGAEPERLLQQSHLRAHTDGMAIATTERYQLLKAAAEMLPAGVHSAHAEALLQRHHHEQLEPAVLRQALLRASLVYPDYVTKHWEGTGCDLVTFFAGSETDRCWDRSAPHILTFQQYWEQLLQQGCRQSNLAPQVYEMSKERSHQHWQQQLLYSAGGAIGTRGSEGLLAYHQGGNTVRLMPGNDGETCQLIATLAGGAIVSAECTGGQQESAAAGETNFSAAAGQAAIPADLPESVLTDKGGLRCAKTGSIGAAGAAECSKPLSPSPLGTPAPPVQQNQEMSAVGIVESLAGFSQAAAADSCAAAGSAKSTAVRVCTPGGLIVELDTEGRVLLAPVIAPKTEVMHVSGVDVLGAPIAAGSLDPALLDGPFAWHALLPDGTLVKASLTAASTTKLGKTATTAAALGDDSVKDLMVSLLHPDGSMSSQQLGIVDVPDGESMPIPGWLRTSLNGHKTWVVDSTALGELKAAATKAAAEAAAAAQAAAAAAAAEAAAAEAAAANKKGKGGDKKALEKQKSAAPPAATAVSNGVDAAAVSQGATTASGSSCLTGTAAIEAKVQYLEQLEPQPRGSIRTAVLTDPDTRAVVVNREDHLMMINYVGGSRLLQDAEGCRISFINEGWTFEASAMPTVRGDTLGVTVEVCPGVILSWSALSKCVTLHHTSSAATLITTPCGRLGYGSQHSQETLELFADMAMPQQSEQHDVPGTAGSCSTLDMSAPAAAEAAQEADMTGNSMDEAAYMTEQARVMLPLPDVCSVQECWGILGMDLCTGEAVLHEQEGCRLHLGPGGQLLVWRNNHNLAHENASQQQESDMQAAALAGAPAASQGSLFPANAEVSAGDVMARSAAGRQSAVGAVNGLDAASGRQGQNDMFDDELDEERTARLAAEAAAAAAAVREAAEAAAATEAARAEAAAKKPPPPVAAAIKPRLFVVDSTLGAGYEILDEGIVSSYIQRSAAVQNCKHKEQAVASAAEPDTVFHQFLTTYSTRSPVLQALPLAEPSAAVTVAADAASSLTSLRRTDVFIPADPVQLSHLGLKLPRVTAMNPGYALTGAGSALHSNKDSVLATRLKALNAGGSARSIESEQVVAVREFLELPVVTPEVQAKAERVLAAVAEAKAAQDAMLADRSPPEDPRTVEQQQQAAEVSELLQAAGFKPMPCHGQLSFLRDQLLADQAASVAEEERAAEEARAKAAAEAAAKQKPYKPWVKKVGPYDHCPKRPQPGRVLKYFETQEGLIAAAKDPLLQGTKITRDSLPPAALVQPASAGIQHKPGVYLSSSTAVVPDKAGDYAAGSAALSYTSNSQSPGSLRRTAQSPISHRTPGSPATVPAAVPHAAPLMYAGKPASLGGPVAPAVMSAISAASTAAAAHLRQQHPGHTAEQAGAAIRAILDDAGLRADSMGTGECDQLVVGASGSVSPVSGASLKSHAYDVYGQPRTVQPPLPAAHLKDQPAAGLNVDYLAREAATMRTAKTSSTSLIRCQGKAGKQLAMSPGHIHFGNVTVGVPAHRTARLLNCSTDVVRFTVVRPELPLRVLHKPAPLPAGMEAVLTVELVAEHAGDFVGEVTVKSEVNVLTLTVSAKVQPAQPEVQQVSSSDAGNTAADGQDNTGNQVQQQ